MVEYQVVVQCQETEKEFLLIVDKSGNRLTAVEGKAISRGTQPSGGSKDVGSIQGQLEIGSTYTGCPHCGNTGFFNCGKQMLPDIGDSALGDMLEWADKKLTGCGSLLCHDGSQTGYCVNCKTPRALLGGDIEELAGATGKEDGGVSRDVEGVILDSDTTKLGKDG